MLLLLLVVVVRRRKQRVCRDEREREREIASRVLVCARLLIEESTVMDLPPNTSPTHPLLALGNFSKFFKTRPKSSFSPLKTGGKKRRKRKNVVWTLSSFHHVVLFRSFGGLFASSFSFECRSFRSFSLSFFPPPDLSSFSIYSRRSS